MAAHILCIGDVTCTGTSATIVGHVGQDSAGAALKSEFDALGVHHHNLVVSGRNSGVVVVLVDPTGERTMFPDNGANSGLTIKDLPPLSPFSAVYLSGYAPLDSASRAGVIEMIRAIKAEGIPIYFDPASVGGMKAVARGEIENWISQMDALLLNEEEAEYLCGTKDIEEALSLLTEKCPLVVIKLGAHGAIAKSIGTSIVRVSAQATEVLDTTGAGDSFAAGFISEYAENGDLLSALTKGSKVAAHCVALLGARPRVGTKI